ncbi:hypothetical protein BOX15_Mlig032614g2, partial [Macrostomum lignano]
STPVHQPQTAAPQQQAATPSTTPTPTPPQTPHLQNQQQQQPRTAVRINLHPDSAATPAGGGGGGGSSMSSNKRPLRQWSVEEVADWLSRRGGPVCGKYVARFREHQISGLALPLLNNARLLLMGVNSSSERDELMRHIMRLRLKYASIELQQVSDIAKSGSAQTGRPIIRHHT